MKLMLQKWLAVTVYSQLQNMKTSLTIVISPTQSQNSIIVSDLKLFFPNFLLWYVFPDASASGDTKSRVTDSSQSPSYRIRTESEQVSLYSPEQSSLHESEGLLLPSLLQSPLL